MTNKGGKKSTTRATIAGVFSSSGKAASRCYNTGNISYKVPVRITRLIKRSGLRALAPEMEQVNAIILEKLQLS